MSRFRLRRPSGATLIALVALFVALGGTSYAAFSLPKNSVGSKQLKNNAVTTAKIKNGGVTTGKIKNGAVTTAKIKNGAVTAGKINTTGLTVPNALHANSASTAINSTNATNATNATTAATTNGQGTLASGKTEVGIVGGVMQNGPTVSSPMATTVTFPLLAPVALGGSSIEVAPTANCTGSTANPTAAAGFVCIYPDVMVAASGISGDTGVNGDKKLGFELDWVATTANSQSSVRAEWAYTAP
ncbi:MAG: hypothetical protein WAK93_01745 [Solirubrobacteraceae bacterium]